MNAPQQFTINNFRFSRITSYPLHEIIATNMFVGVSEIPPTPLKKGGFFSFLFTPFLRGSPQAGGSESEAIRPYS
ncbi:hypothetical protein F8S12_28645 [Nostoc sp. WHI]|nr:hypothetical protein [Nostoc sp. WHI]